MLSLVFLTASICHATVILRPEPVINVNDHKFDWHGTTFGSSFLDELTTSTSSNQFYYIFTGDTQYWFKCTPQNFECHRQTGFCDTGTLACQKRQGNYANELQKVSLRSLIGQMDQRNLKPKGLVINGDLTQFGHEGELEYYKNSWTLPVEGVQIYPGLGNHDYANNINSCALNHCANRMLTWFRKYIRTILHRPMDMTQKTDWAIYNTFTGSLSYSWDQCVGNNCVHFLQLNNYPTYYTEFKWLLAKWKIRSSMSFVHRDLDKNIGKPIIINFHDIDSHFSSQDQQRFKRLISNPAYNIIAIFFAHYHSQVGLHPTGYWCLNGKRVPLLYSGSVPANNYILARLEPDSNAVISQLYVLHANDEQGTNVQKILLNKMLC